MSDDLFARLAALADRELRFEAGAGVFAMGEPVRALHLVRTGEAALIRHQPDGLALTLQRAGAGAVLAEASLFAGHYHCDGVALAPSVLLALPRARVVEALGREPDLALAWTRHLAGEIQKTRARAEILTLRTVAARLDAWLSLAGGPLPDRGAWRRLADELGVSPEALYRELARRRRSARA